MASRDASPAVPVERFFQLSLLGLLASGFLAVAGSGALDTPTIVLTAAGLALRGAMICGHARLEISERVATIATIAYAGFYVADYLAISRGFLAATVHLAFFLMVLKALAARSTRDHLYTAIIAFLELVAAAVLSVSFSFFVFLTLALLFGIAALSAGEIRRSMRGAAAATARSGLGRFHSRLALLSVTVTAGILVLTGGLFFLLPRTAEAAFSRFVAGRLHLPGFSDQVNLGEIGEIKATSRPVMHIHIWGPQQALKWRGGALVDFDGRRWSNNARPSHIPVIDGEAQLTSDRATGRRLNYDIHYDEVSTNALFFAGTPESVLRLRVPEILAAEGASYRLRRAPGAGFHYEAYSLLETPPDFGPPPYPPPKLPLESRERCLQLPALDPRIPALAREWTAGLPDDLARARAIERRLRVDYGYTLQLPSREVADPLAYFLFERRKGHCEYFASAMAVILRTIGVPSRLATGFQSGVFNSMTDLWLVRASDAHSWVEAWLPGRGWTTFDPTPPDPDAGFPLLARLGLYLDTADTFWREWILGYDAGQQGSLADRMEQGARRAGGRWLERLEGAGASWDGDFVTPLKRYGVPVAAAIVVALCLWAAGPAVLRRVRIRGRIRRARRGQVSVADAALLYQRMLEIVGRHGRHKPAWFTPVEFATSLGNSPLAAPVIEFTAAYNALRFGGRAEMAPRLSALLEELERHRS